MFPFREKTTDKAKPTEWFAWSKAPSEAASTRRTISLSRGKAKAYVLIGDNIEPETDARVAAVCAESFIGKPSLKPIAFQTILGFANNIVLARRKPSVDFSYDAVCMFLFKNEAAWVISGNASAILFVDGEPVRQSAEKVYPSIGSSPAYKAQAEGPFAMTQGETALLLSCGAPWTAEDAQAIGAMLRGSESPARWMERILERYPDQCTSAMTVFLPAPHRHASHESHA